MDQAGGHPPIGEGRERGIGPALASAPSPRRSTRPAVRAEAAARRDRESTAPVYPNGAARAAFPRLRQTASPPPRGEAAGGEEAERLLALTSELGRLAGEIAQAARPFAGDGRRPDAQAVRALIRARRDRAASFGADLFSDPAWEMMLDLLAARLEGRPVPTSNLCIAAGVPTTTALRWIRQLTERGLFVRSADPSDGRGVLIALSDETAERLLDHLAGAGARA